MEEIKIDEYGNKFYYLNGQLHRNNDLPAIEWADGTKSWWVNGKLHRENDLPAIEWAVEYLKNDIIKIGCQKHSKNKWRKFSDDEISKMHKEALKFWKLYKEKILA